MQITDEELEKVNQERKAKGLPPISRDQARYAVERRREADRSTDFDIIHFLIAYNTGFPMPSAAGVIGATHVQPTPEPEKIHIIEPPALEPMPAEDYHSAYDSGSKGGDYSPPSSDYGGSSGGGGD